MQLNLIPQKDLRAIKAYTHGGISLKKRRKIARPLLANKITHVVFKSSKAKGDFSFYKHKKMVASLLKEKSHKFFIEILDWVNMGNHLHLKVRFKDRRQMGKFLKSFTALLARKITANENWVTRTRSLSKPIQPIHLPTTTKKSIQLELKNL